MVRTFIGFESEVSDKGSVSLSIEVASLGSVSSEALSSSSVFEPTSSGGSESRSLGFLVG